MKKIYSAFFFFPPYLPTSVKITENLLKHNIWGSNLQEF